MKRTPFKKVTRIKRTAERIRTRDMKAGKYTNERHQQINNRLLKAARLALDTYK